MLDNLIGAFQLFVGAPPLSPRLPGRKQIFSRSIALRIFPRFYARIIRFSRKKMTDEWRGAGVRRRAGKGQCNGSGRRCLGLSLDLGLDLSTFAIVPEAIPYWLWGGRASEHITWLNRPNGIATGLAALTLLKYPPPSPRPFNKTFTRGPPNYSDTYRPLYRRETTPPTTSFQLSIWPVICNLLQPRKKKLEGLISNVAIYI